LLQTNCAMADIDRTVAQGIIDKRFSLEDSHFSQRMQRQQQLLEVSESRVRELEEENKALLLRLTAADGTRLKAEEAAVLQQQALQRTCEELASFKERLAEARDASAIEVASAAGRHARELQEQQRAAVASARSFKALLQQRDAKIADLQRLVDVLTPPKVRVGAAHFSAILSHLRAAPPAAHAVAACRTRTPSISTRRCSSSHAGAQAGHSSRVSSMELPLSLASINRKL
jgi:hypothetical protein